MEQVVVHNAKGIMAKTLQLETTIPTCPFLEENHPKSSLSKHIIDGTNICDMSYAFANQCYELIIENQNNDDYRNLKDIEEVKYDNDIYLKCGEMNYYYLEKSHVDSSLNGKFSNASLSGFNAFFLKTIFLLKFLVSLR